MDVTILAVGLDHLAYVDGMIPECPCFFVLPFYSACRGIYERWN